MAVLKTTSPRTGLATPNPRPCILVPSSRLSLAVAVCTVPELSSVPSRSLISGSTSAGRRVVSNNPAKFRTNHEGSADALCHVHAYRISVATGAKKHEILASGQVIPGGQLRRNPEHLWRAPSK